MHMHLFIYLRNHKSASLLKALNNESDLETSQTPSTTLYAQYCIKMHDGNTKIEWIKVQRKTSMIAWD